MSKEPLLLIENVSHYFEHKLQSGGTTKIDKALTKIFGRKEKVCALHNINLTLFEGEIVGIIGKSGAGKSTLGDVMSGLITPDSGRVLAKETPRLLSGFANYLPKLSGARNIALILAAHGLSDKEIETTLPQIIKRAKIRKIVHQPINTYTKKARQKLRGAIALSLLPKILIADTPLKAGDKKRTDELRQEMRQIAASGGLVVLAGQRLDLVEAMCSRVIWLERGMVHMDGLSQVVIHAFRERFQSETDGADDDVVDDTLRLD